MELYFSPLACSMATRITMDEAGLDGDFRHVTLKTKKVEGEDFLKISPLGLHAEIFSLLFRPDADDAVTGYAIANSRSRFDELNRRLKGREAVLDRFTIADAYLFTVLNWAQATPIKLSDWPDVQRYFEIIKKRPSVARALGAEFPLYRA